MQTLFDPALWGPQQRSAPEPAAASEAPDAAENLLFHQQRSVLMREAARENRAAAERQRRREREVRFEAAGPASVLTRMGDAARSFLRGRDR